MWCGLAKTYNSLLAARILQAFGGGAADTVAPAVVGDLFVVHQRGRAMVRKFRAPLRFFKNSMVQALTSPGILYGLSLRRPLLRGSRRWNHWA